MHSPDSENGLYLLLEVFDTKTGHQQFHASAYRDDADFYRRSGAICHTGHPLADAMSMFDRHRFAVGGMRRNSSPAAFSSIAGRMPAAFVADATNAMIAADRGAVRKYSEEIFEDLEWEYRHARKKDRPKYTAVWSQIFDTLAYEESLPNLGETLTTPRELSDEIRETRPTTQPFAWRQFLKRMERLTPTRPAV